MGIITNVFRNSVDPEEMHSIILQAAISGNISCREALKSCVSGFQEPYSTIGLAIAEMHSEGVYIDSHTLMNRLEDRTLNINRGGIKQTLSAAEAINLVSNPTDNLDEKAEAYLPVIQRQLDSERKKEEQRELDYVIEKNRETPAVLVEKINSLVERSHTKPVVEAPFEVDEAVSFVHFLQNHFTGQEKRGLKTGFDRLDTLLGGLNPGVFVVGGKPGSGKTTLCWQIANHVAQKEKCAVVYLTMEQAKETFRFKTLSRLSGVSYRKISRGSLTEGGRDFAAVMQAAQTYMTEIAPFLTIYEGKVVTPTEVAQLVEQAKKKIQSDRALLVVDYLQLVQPDNELGKNASAKDRLDAVFSSFAQMASRQNIAALLISSLNRLGYNKSGELDVFKESGAIEYGTNVAAVLGEAGTISTEDSIVSRELDILKSRESGLGKITFDFEPDLAWFDETGSNNG